MNIIEMAKEAGFEELYGWKDDGSCEISYELFATDLELFAALVRERCYANARAEREWVDLTDDEMRKHSEMLDCEPDFVVFRAVIAKFKEKNNG